MYRTASEIEVAFIKDGWSPNTKFELLTDRDADGIGCHSIVAAMNRGRKFFRMTANGNIYDDQGKIVIFNIPTCREQDR